MDWLVDTGWACAWVRTKGWLIVDAAPIFRKYKGRNFHDLTKCARKYWRLNV